MTTKRLTVAGIQIYFNDDGVALFDARGKQRAAVELELNEYRDFIDQWLESSEEPAKPDPRPRRLTEDEQKFRRNLKGIVKYFARHPFYDKELIEMTIRLVAKHRRDSANLTAIQIEEGITDAISPL